MTTNNTAGQPIATPTLNHVIALDLAIRKRQAELMNEGLDYKAALEKAKESDRLFQTNFLNTVAMDINTAACRSVSAPGVTAAPGANKRGAQLALEDDGETPSQRKKRRQNNKKNKSGNEAPATTPNTPKDGNKTKKGDGRRKGSERERQRRRQRC